MRPLTDPSLVTLLNDLSEIIMITNVESSDNYTIEYVNSKFLTIFNLNKKQVIGRSIKEVLPETNYQDLIKKYPEIINQQQASSFQTTISLPFDSIPVHCKLIPVRNEGDCSHIVWVGTPENEITLKKEKEQDLLYSKFMEKFPQGVIIISNGQIVFVNDRFSEIYGYSQEELLRLTYQELLAPEEQAKYKQKMEQVLDNDEFPATLEFWIIRKDGKRRFVQNNYRFIKHDGLKSTLVISKDITETKYEKEAGRFRVRLKDFLCRVATDFINGPLEKIDQNIEQTLKNLARFTNSKKSSIYLFSKDLTKVTDLHSWPPGSMKEYAGLVSSLSLTDFNQFIKRLSHGEIISLKSKEDLPTKNGTNVFEDFEFNQKILVPLIAEGNLFGVLELCDFKDYYLLQKDTMYSLLELFGAMFATALNRKRMTKIVRKKEKRFKDLITNAFEWIWEVDRKSNITFSNPIIEQLLGYQGSEIISQSIYNLLPTEQRGDIQEKIRQKIFNREPIEQLTHPLVHKNGQLLWVRTNATPFFDDHYNFLGYRGASTNITDLKSKEQQILSSKEMFRSFSEQSLVGIIVVQEGRVVYANERAAEISGYSFAEAKKWSSEQFIQIIVHPKDRLFVLDQLRKKQRGKKDVLERYDIRIIDKNKQTKWLSVNSKTITFNGESALEIIVIDITKRKKLEQKLQKKEEQNLALFNNAPIGIVQYEVLYDEEGNNTDLLIINLNKKYEKIVGLKKEQIIGKRVSELFLNVETEQECELGKLTKELLITGKPISKELYMHSIDKWLDFSAFISDEKYITVTFRDITSQKETKEQLIKNEQRYRFLFNNTPVGYQSLDADGNIIEVNKPWLELMGYSREEVIGRWFGKFLTPKGIEIYKKNFPEFKQTGTIRDVEHHFIRKDGKELTVIINGAISYDEDGEFIQTHCLVRDITKQKELEKELQQHRNNLEELVIKRTQQIHEMNQQLSQEIKKRKRMEQKLHKQKEKYQTLFNTGRDATFVHKLTADGLPGKFVEVNDIACKRYGYSREEWLQITPIDIDHPKLKNKIPNTMQTLFDKGYALFTMEHVTKDGKIIPVEINSQLFRHNDELLVISIARDITKRKETEEELQQLTLQLQIKIRQLECLYQVSKLTKDCYQAYHEITPKILTIIRNAFQYPKKTGVEIQIENQKFSTANFSQSHWTTSAEIISKGEKIGQIQVSYQKDFLKTKDSPFLVEEVNLLNNLANELAKFIERRKIEEQVQFRNSLLDQVRNAVIAVDLDGTIIFWNKFAERIYQWKAEEALGKNVKDLIVPPDNINIAQKAIKELKLSGHWEGEFIVQRKDGSTFPVYVTDSRLQSLEGETIGFITVFTDISELKRIEEEKERLQVQLLQAQKREMVRSLINKLVTEFNEQLSVIQSYLELSLRVSEPKEPLYSHLTKAATASMQAANLLHQLLIYGRKRFMDLTSLNLNLLINIVLKNLGWIFGEEIDQEVDLAPNLPQISGDEDYLEQMITNLLIYAKESLEEGKGKITIKTSPLTVEGDHLEKKDLELESGKFVRLVVKTTGLGMDKETIQKVFKPLSVTQYFNDTKVDNLANVFTIVKQHEGWMNISSELGKDSTITIYLPVHQESIL